jgi:hypothetical protein
MMNTPSKSFADYKEEGYLWITLAKGEYYPDYLIDASNLYKPVQEMFGQLMRSSASSEQLFWIFKQFQNKQCGYNSPVFFASM